LKKILILFAHPALQKSRINKILVKGISDIEAVTFHDLYQVYPDFDIDVDKEKKLLEEHDIIVFHHPFFWYSTPAMLKEWQDLVLEHGWAYGSKGTALKDKIFFNVLTSGGRREAYSGEGYNRFKLRTTS
jgi:glutathione-regulated potassium-efflux system ancillary protein KefG